MNYLNPALDKKTTDQVSVLGLAYIGDGVYELLVSFTVLSDLLTDEEKAVFKRGRNAKVNQIPHHATSGEYHTATGLEALFGWLYLTGKQERIQELFSCIMNHTEYD